MKIVAPVQDQIHAYRESRLVPGSLTFVSEYSQKTFPVAEAEVDHVTPFHQIVDHFFGQRNIDLTTSLLTRAVDAQSAPIWREALLIADFQAFHRHYPLRLVHHRENQSDLKRAR